MFGSPARDFARHNILAFSMVLVTGVALLLTMALITFVATFEGLLLRFRASGEYQGLGFLGGLAPSLVTFAFFFAIYRVVPRRVSTARHAALGALLATILWELTRRGLIWYFQALSMVNLIYGPIGIAVGALLCVEVAAIIILLGAQVIAELQAGRDGDTHAGEVSM